MGQRAVLVEVQPQLGGLHGDLAGEPALLDRVEHRDVVIGDRVRLGDALEVSPSFVYIVPMPAACSGAAASSADSSVSPGMNRRTARRMNRIRGRWSRSQAFRAAHRKTPAHQGRLRTRPPSTGTIAPVT